MQRLAVFLFVSAAAVSATPVDGQEVADKRPTKIWNRTGPLGETPKHVTDAYPLSDQDNKVGWVKFEPMSDEFDGQELDPNKWNRGMYWWKGRQPALFSDKNVTVSDGKLHLTMRKEKVSEKFDVFEIGGNAKGFEHKYNMNLHVFRTPQEKKHWSVGGVWEAPWRFADVYHVYGLEWNQDEIKYFVDGVLVRSVENTHWHQPLFLIFDSETMPEWFGMPDDKDLPSTFSVEYVRAWKMK
jgi:hypothetical protein